MRNRPVIGLLGLMTDGYEQTFPGIMAHQKAYGEELAESLSSYMDVVFEKIGGNRKEIEEIVKDYNCRELDGILIVLLAYSQGAWLLNAMRENRLPVALAVLQPDDVADEDFVELDLTRNQGIHGAQDNCNILMRLGIPYEIYAGSRKDDRFFTFAENYGRTCMTIRELRQMRIGVMGRMQGMGDILLDESTVFRKLGIEICHDSLGCVRKEMDALDPQEIEKELEADHERFQMDEKLSEESHRIAIEEYLGFKKYLEKNGYDGFTAHFDMFGQDGRFRQLPLYAASRLMADGYGYAAEGDILCAAMVRAAGILSGRPANFTEMYMMDQKTKSILFCHAGEGNYASAEKRRKPRLIDRYLGEGGLENPPTIMFLPRPGKATLVSLVPVEGGHMKLLTACGEILDKDDMRQCEMPYFFFRPDSGMETCVENWLRAGGIHHEVICLGDVKERWKMLCHILNLEYLEV